MVGVADTPHGERHGRRQRVGARPYVSYDALVAAEDVEVVDICLPTAFHKDVALRAAGEGRHVILEKPIARTLEDAQESSTPSPATGPASSSATSSGSSPSTWGSKA